MNATVRRHRAPSGNPDADRFQATCSVCDWQSKALYSNRTVEGRTLAERDAKDHNRARHIQRGLSEAPATYGLCLHCQSIEVELNNVSGIRDLSSIGESDTYPTGYGCEVCA